VLKEVFRPVAAVHAAGASIPQRITFSLRSQRRRAGDVPRGRREKAKVIKAVLTETATACRRPWCARPAGA